MSINKRYLWIIASTVITVQAWSQVANSPFSRYGVGELYSNALVNTQGAGGIGVSHPQYWFTNNQNPALLVYNTMATFQAGVLGESRTVKNARSSEKYAGANMNYLVLAFPVKAFKWSSAVGLLPYSTLNYSVEHSEQIEGTDASQVVTEEGRGGLTQFYYSNGVRLNKYFAVGLKITYLFGSVNRNYKFKPITSNATLTSSIENKNVSQDGTFDLGGSYSKDSIWGTDNRFSIGAVYGFGSNVKTTLVNKFADLTAGGDTVASTIQSKIKGSTHIPGSTTVGMSFSKGSKWVVGTEFHYQDWSSFTTIENKSKSLRESWRVSVGGEYTPDPFALKGILKRTTYRLGVSTEQSPFLVNNKSVKDTGINFGFSLPTNRSSIDLAFKLGKRGNKAENTLEETYFKVFLGLTFNDKWFIRRKFD